MSENNGSFTKKKEGIEKTDELAKFGKKRK
jgi:hypothetical protein